MNLKVLSGVVLVFIVVLFAVPTLAAGDGIGSAVVADSASMLSKLTDTGISDWLDTIINFLTTYLGEVFDWLS